MRKPIWERSKKSTSCHGSITEDLNGIPLVVIVGQPNVGKSMLFNRLTGSYVSVSNYPGTTVEISRGKMGLPCCETRAGIVDTPGMFSLFAITEEERVARRILLQERPHAVLNVIDAKNIERMLPLTLQLIEAGLPLVLDLNLLDEAEWLGMEIDIYELSRRLGIPVLGTVCTTGRGIDALKESLFRYVHADCSI